MNNWTKGQQVIVDKFCNDHNSKVRFLRSVFYDEQDGAEQILEAVKRIEAEAYVRGKKEGFEAGKLAAREGTKDMGEYWEGGNEGDFKFISAEGVDEDMALDYLSRLLKKLRLFSIAVEEESPKESIEEVKL